MPNDDPTATTSLRSVGLARHGAASFNKKNWIFVGEADASQRGAIIYTVIESCRRRGLDPSAYLRDLFTRLPAATNWQLPELPPAAWLKTRLASQIVSA